jgi:HlyD family secretion protein
MKKLLWSLLACLLFVSCAKQDSRVYQGYAEGEYVRVASPFAGRLQTLSVARGMTVNAGDPLFVLEQENESALRREAEERLRAAEAQLANLQSGKRPAELDAIRAQLAQANAGLDLSRVQLQRAQELAEKNLIPETQLDSARTIYNRDTLRVAELNAQLSVARLAARPDEIAAAESNVEAARAVLEQAEWRLEQKSVQAPVTGLVEDTYFTTGEWVSANIPVVSLLPPQNIKVRFFVSEKYLGSISTGHKAEITCDGCGAPIPAEITYISSNAEFTPPVLYTQKERAKLVYLVEARPSPDDAVKLHPGQPVEVKLQ